MNAGRRTYKRPVAVVVGAQHEDDLTMPFSLPWAKENAQRKYIDLIKEASSKWANWDPPKRIQVSLVIHSSPHFLIVSPFHQIGRRLRHSQPEDGGVPGRGKYIYAPGYRIDRQRVSSVGDA